MTGLEYGFNAPQRDLQTLEIGLAGCESDQSCADRKMLSTGDFKSLPVLAVGQMLKTTIDIKHC